MLKEDYTRPSTTKRHSISTYYFHCMKVSLVYVTLYFDSYIVNLRSEKKLKYPKVNVFWKLLYECFFNLLSSIFIPGIVKRILSKLIYGVIVAELITHKYCIILWTLWHFDNCQLRSKCVCVCVYYVHERYVRARACVYMCEKELQPIIGLYFWRELILFIVACYDVYSMWCIRCIHSSGPIL